MISRLLALALLGSLACTRKPAPAPAPPPPPAAAPAPAPDAADALPQEDELKPVYSGFDGQPLPLAQKLCAAVYDVSAQRRGACCKTSATSSPLTALCSATVSAGLRSKGITIDEAAVDRCAAAQAKAHQGCSWVGPGDDPLPDECGALIQGARKAGEVCRSSLECGDGQHCLGVGPMDPGRCGPPRGDNQGCRQSVDPLANYARQSEDAHHPECAGWCGHYKCLPRAAAGAACRVGPECQAGLHCDGQKCVEGAVAKAGEACVAECAAGAHCVAGRCKEIKPDGAACTSDAECLGGCLPATHTCGMRCG